MSIQEQLVSLGGFKGQVTLSAAVTPNIPNAPAFSFLPSTVDLSAGTRAGYTALVSTTMLTPVGNYIVAITVTNGTISHVYQAIMMVGDYRPQSEQPGPGNSTSTGNRPSSNSAATNILSPFGNASSALSTLRSFWWLQTIIGLSIATLVVYRRRPALSRV